MLTLFNFHPLLECLTLNIFKCLIPLKIKSLYSLIFCVYFALLETHDYYVNITSDKAITLILSEWMRSLNFYTIQSHLIFSTLEFSISPCFLLRMKAWCCTFVVRSFNKQKTASSHTIEPHLSSSIGPWLWYSF